MKISLTGGQAPPAGMPLSAVQAALCNVRVAQEQTVKLLGEMLKVSTDTLGVLKEMRKSMDDANEKYEKAMVKSDEMMNTLKLVKVEVELDRQERMLARNAHTIPVEQI